MTDPALHLLTDAVKAMIGVESPVEIACDVVEAGAVRRYAQAIMDEDPRYGQEGASNWPGGPVAPPLFPLHMFRRRLGAPDPFAERADDPDFDGLPRSTSQGLPPLPVGNLALLNGGLEVEFFRYARHGETITSQSRYLDITEKLSSKGPMLLVRIETDYRSGDGELIVRATKTLIRR